jgi:hypothetical protein
VTSAAIGISLWFGGPSRSGESETVSAGGVTSITRTWSVADVVTLGSVVLVPRTAIV